MDSEKMGAEETKKKGSRSSEDKANALLVLVLLVLLRRCQLLSRGEKEKDLQNR